MLFIFANNPYFVIITSDTSLTSSQGSVAFPFFCLLLPTTLDQILVTRLLPLSAGMEHLSRLLALHPGYNCHVRLQKTHVIALILYGYDDILGTTNTLRASFPYPYHFPVRKELGDNKELKRNKITNIEA